MLKKLLFMTYEWHVFYEFQIGHMRPAHKKKEDDEYFFSRTHKKGTCPGKRGHHSGLDIALAMWHPSFSASEVCTNSQQTLNNQVVTHHWWVINCSLWNTGFGNSFELPVFCFFLLWVYSSLLIKKTRAAYKVLPHLSNASFLRNWSVWLSPCPSNELHGSTGDETPPDSAEPWSYCWTFPNLD